MITPELLASVKKHEGYRERAYKDSVEVWTIGYGTNLEALTIDRELATKWLHEGLKRCEREAERMSFWNNLNQPRKDVVLEMLYNLGLPRFNKFVRMHTALNMHDFHEAAEQMKDSLWATQVGLRADVLAQQMRLGEYDDRPESAAFVSTVPDRTA